MSAIAEWSQRHEIRLARESGIDTDVLRHQIDVLRGRVLDLEALLRMKDDQIRVLRADAGCARPPVPCEGAERGIR